MLLCAASGRTIQTLEEQEKLSLMLSLRSPFFDIFYAKWYFSSGAGNIQILFFLLNSKQQYFNHYTFCFEYGISATV